MKFKLELGFARTQIINSIVPTFNSNNIIGYINEADMHNIKYMRVYIVSSVEYEYHPIYKNPMVIVAMNESNAVDYYGELTNTPGSVIGILEDNAENITVEEYDE